MASLSISKTYFCPTHITPSCIKAKSKTNAKTTTLLKNKEKTKAINKIFSRWISNPINDPPLHPSVNPKDVFAGNYAPVNELPPTACSIVHGSLPPDLNGVYIRNGSNPQHPPIGPLHLFEGDGMLHSLKISNGHAVFCSRYVETYKYTSERRAGVPIFPNVFSGVHGVADLFRYAVFAWRILTGSVDLRRGVGLANTGVSCFANKLLALGESDLPYIIRVTPDGDLKTAGRWDLDKRFLTNMSAHLKMDTATGEAFAFRCRPVFPYLTYFRFDRDGNKDVDCTVVSVSERSFIHDFAITERFVIFLETQLVTDGTKLILRQGMPVVSDPNKVPRIGLMPRYATSDTGVQWFQAPHFNAVHIVNAWEDKDDNIIIIVASNVVSINTILTDLKTPKLSFEKLKIDTGTGEVTRRVMSDKNLEFGSVNEAYIGKNSRYAYLGVCEDLTKMLGVVKIDLEMGCEVSRRFYGRSCFGGEPLFVARNDDVAAEEDDGYVVTYVHDEETGESRFLVMDAKSPELDVVAVVELPGRVPYGFHGIFVRDKTIT